MSSYSKYHSHKEAGLCVQCSNPALSGVARCQYHTDAMRRNLRASALRRKQDVIEALGGKCVCCGENRLPFLQIDHINGDGAAFRKQITGSKRGGVQINVYIKNGKAKMSDLQILCANCHQSKTSLGYCIHKGTK